MDDNIEIVIKISEKEYNGIKEDNSGMFGGHIYQAIKNGRPLSEYCPVIHHKKPITKEDIDKSTWIPVTERLPEIAGPYLITIKDELRGGLHAIVCNYVQSNIFPHWERPDVDGPIIAWKPISKPYRESEEKKE